MLGKAAAGASLLRALCSDGAVILRLGPAAHATVSACYDAARRFFALPFNEKALAGAGDGLGQLHGFMSYLDDPEGSECFEAKVHHDPRFMWPDRPPKMRAAFLAALRLLASTARAALAALVEALVLDWPHVASLIDVDRGDAADSGSSPFRSVDLSTCSHSAMRVWSYTYAQPSGWHCDNTLLTIAPAGSSVGLRVRTLDGRCWFPEASMAAGELLLFAGDALGYLTAGRVPALMHDVVPPPLSEGGSAIRGQGRPARLSIPFFLRGKRAAVLRPPAHSGLPPLQVALLEHNPHNLRSSWPWKRNAEGAAYYGGQEHKWHLTDESGNHSTFGLKDA